MFESRTSKEVILLSVTLCTSVAIFIFTILRFIQQDYIMVAIDIVILLTMMFIFAWTYYRKNLVVASYLFMLFSLLSVTVTIFQKGEAQIFWCFPATVMVFYIVSLRVATCFTLIMYFIVGITLHAEKLTHPLTIFAITFPLTAILVAISVNQLNRANKQLENLVKHDALTGTLNRLALNERLEKIIDLQSRQPAQICLMMMDLDNFKSINDKHGHLVGDQVLIEFTRIIDSRLRKTDELYRYGGEEFVLIPHIGELNDAYIFAEQLRELVASSPLFAKYQLTVSIGVAAYHENESAEQWLSCADNALYAAKDAGKNKVLAAKAPVLVTQPS